MKLFCVAFVLFMLSPVSKASCDFEDLKDNKEKQRQLFNATVMGLGGQLLEKDSEKLLDGGFDRVESTHILPSYFSWKSYAILFRTHDAGLVHVFGGLICEKDEIVVKAGDAVYRW